MISLRLRNLTMKFNKFKMIIRTKIIKILIIIKKILIKVKKKILIFLQTKLPLSINNKISVENLILNLAI
jgi:hypothetical protein